MGVVAPVGQTTRTFFAGLVAARSGIRRLESASFPGVQSLIAGQVDFHAPRLRPRHLTAQLDRAVQFALVVAKQALDEGALGLTDAELERAGVYWGTGLGGATTTEESYKNLFAGDGRVRPSAVVTGMSNAAAGQISITHGLRPPLLNISTACSPSASATGEAHRVIQGGHPDVSLAGGTAALRTTGLLRACEH